MEAVRYLLLKYKEDIHPRFNIPFILESIDFILMSLTVNTFYSFRVLQCDTVHCDLIELNYNLDIRLYFVGNWKRFLDDCEIL